MKLLPRCIVGLNIKSDEAHEMATELASLRGTSLSKAVTDAIRNELERERRQRAKTGLSEELLGIGRRCAAHIEGPISSQDHAAMLYDDLGLPR
jgi:antitoxin VapB